MTTIAVTGATGFIGAHICNLLESSNHRVRALVRSPERAAQRLSASVELVAGDLADARALAGLCDGADAVVHCAGTVRGSRPADFNAVNVTGLQQLLRVMSAAAGGPAYLVALSSLAAREPQLSHYAASKHRGEQLVTDAAPGIAGVVLRPPAVYGNGDREMLPVFRLMARGLAPLPGSPRARLSLLHVDDLARAVIACLGTRPRPAGIFELDDGQCNGYDWAEIAAIVSSLCQRRVRLLRVPAPALNMLAQANRLAARLIGYAPMFTPEKLRELRHPNWVAHTGQLQLLTGWQPQLALAQGLTMTSGWR